jgi:hypothetical protein
VIVGSGLPRLNHSQALGLPICQVAEKVYGLRNTFTGFDDVVAE